jgi:hypothetical protein
MLKLLLLVAIMGFLLPPTPAIARSPQIPSHSQPYILVGGQNGTWFQPGQQPRLYQVLLSNYSAIQLTPVPSEGTVWTGGWNGSEWFISGWGTDPGPKGSNPYLYLYDGKTQAVGGSLDQYEAESSWHGGDIFAASYNGKEWLLTGMGSDILPSFLEPANHLAMATFNGTVFIDLSMLVPEQQDGILYANAWNGKYWLIGGGYQYRTILFTFDGNRTIDLTSQVADAVTNLAAVQAIAWNGKYWLIGGVGFLAEYDGENFVDLTAQLNAALHVPSDESVIVNAIAWNGSSWMIGGGTPVAQLTPDHAWIASYDSNVFIDLSSTLPSYVTQPNFANSSILTICYANNSWIFGGYSNNHAILLSYKNGSMTDISDLVRTTMTYVIWLGAGNTQLL